MWRLTIYWQHTLVPVTMTRWEKKRCTLPRCWKNTCVKEYDQTGCRLYLSQYSGNITARLWLSLLLCLIWNDKRRFADTIIVSFLKSFCLTNVPRHSWGNICECLWHRIILLHKKMTQKMALSHEIIRLNELQIRSSKLPHSQINLCMCRKMFCCFLLPFLCENRNSGLLPRFFRIHFFFLNLKPTAADQNLLPSLSCYFKQQQRCSRKSWGVALYSACIKHILHQTSNSSNEVSSAAVRHSLMWGGVMIQRVGAGGAGGGGWGCKPYKLAPTCPPPSLICSSAAQSQMEADSVHQPRLSFHLLLISVSIPTLCQQCFW